MQICMMLKIINGPRTKSEIIVSYKSVNEKQLYLKNGQKVSEYEVGVYIANKLKEILL